MKLAVTPFNVASVPALLEAGADIIIAGNGHFANRLTTSFSNIELREIREITKNQNKELYIQVNMIVHNKDLEELKLHLSFLMDLDVDGIIFGDIAVLQIAREHHFEEKLIYNPETLNTNYYDAIFWQRKGIKGITIAKEIPLEDMRAFHEQSTIELSLIGHGHLNMFQSRRPLIENYFKYNQEDHRQYIENRNLRLVEEIREESYPIFQDDHGTHIFRDKVMASYEEIDALKDLVDVFIIDGIFKDTAYIKETIQHYRFLLDHPNSKKAKQFAKQYQDDHDTGFLHKKTTYEKGGSDE
ncbi:peptidase U32 family protein [Candidatus Xianfuyuplasma coldseepsis]|uniref:U32 family peptidase n=1 Tax=Candidatus Xianfuyuplasma coldseepsis TaxID=2782163 RepID=A0A7L7KTN8_9MOLU|nr:peptidase U32 family protein [Xianfuyuplasma coldseepsis]QMS85616.1 U32 family peptidase [Xianfuyuplasma coldseepsis]